jgi:ABC-type multidrug transport system ATPase subunit
MNPPLAWIRKPELWKTIQQFKTHATIILTTHYLDEADHLSDHILMLNRGKVVMTGTPKALKEQVALKDEYEFVFHQPEAQRYLDQLVGQLNGQTAGLSVIDPFRLRLKSPAPGLSQAVLAHLPFEALQRFGSLEPDLETVFFAVAGAPE